MKDQQCQKTASACLSVWETLSRLVAECHSHILCSHCATSLLTLASSMLNCVSIRRLRVPWWFALMSQSISVCLPSIWDHLQGNHNQTPGSYLESSLRCCLSLNITFSIHKLSLSENQVRREENMALESLEGHNTVPFDVMVMNMFFNRLENCSNSPLDKL